MENIVEKYFNEYIKKNYYYFAETDNTRFVRKSEIFYILTEKLDKETLKLVYEFLDLKNEQVKIESKAAFEIGFKTAVSLMKDINNI